MFKEDGHRVRLATHANFKEFVSSAGLGGNPKVLAEYMVKNKGFLPSGASEIHIQRSQMRDIIFSLLPAYQNAYPDILIYLLKQMQLLPIRQHTGTHMLWST